MQLPVPAIVNKDLEGRTFYILDLDSFEAWPQDIELVSSRYVVAVFADASDSDVESISTAMSRALHTGAVYICACGLKCDLVHDVADEIIVNEEMEKGGTADVIFTTWHSSESKLDALWFFANAAIPAKAYEESCSSWLLVRIGKYRDDQVLERWLRDLRELDREHRTSREAPRAP